MGLSGQSVPWEAAALKHTVLLLSQGGESRARGGCSRRAPAEAALGPHTGEQWPLSPSWVTPHTAHTGHVTFLPKNLPLPDGSAGIPTHQRPCFCFSILSLFPGPSVGGLPREKGRPPVLPAGPSPASSLLLCCLQSWESAPSGRGSGRVSVPMRRAPDLCLRPTPLLKLSCKGMTDLRHVLFSPSADS